MRRCLSCSRQFDSAITTCPSCQASGSALSLSTGPAVADAQESVSCSVCDRSIPPKLEGEFLYGYQVCSGCRSEFASQRIFAQLIDLFAWGFFLLFLAGVFRSFASSGWITIICLVVAIPGYLMKDYLNGGSVGKQITGLRVIDAETGEALSARASLLRNLPLVIPGVPLAVAFKLLDGYRLGDRYANSKVIPVSRSRRAPFLPGSSAASDISYPYSSRLGEV